VRLRGAPGGSRPALLKDRRRDCPFVLLDHVKALIDKSYRSVICLFLEATSRYQYLTAFLTVKTSLTRRQRFLFDRANSETATIDR
jgi:hypothetical protein